MMSLGKALRFVRIFASDHQFKKQCHTLTKDELINIFGFNEIELDEAINMQLVDCTSEEEADVYQRLRIYYFLL